MTPISEELALIINLHNASKFHKKNCQDEHCNVTLLGLKRAALYILPNISLSYKDRDYDEACKIIEDMPTI